jgi:hypothetical protein
MTSTLPAGGRVLLNNREPHGSATFPEKQIAAVLRQLGLPPTSPLSALAAEILPGPIQSPPDRPDVAAQATTSAGPDPLGVELGSRRILRTSPLTAAPAIC